MRKQYRYKMLAFAKYHLYIYHDGKMIDRKELWVDDINKEIEILKNEGYTYGFTHEEIYEVKRRYKYMLENSIGEI